MKIRLLKDIPRPPKNPFRAGLIREVTNEKGAEMIATGLWEEYTGKVIDESQPRSKSNPKKESDK